MARLEREAIAFRAATRPIAFAAAIDRRVAAGNAAVGRGRGVRRVSRSTAAAVLFWLRAAPDVRPVPVPAPSTTPSNAPAGDVVRFKGGLAVAAIRDRAGRQERLSGPFDVRPGDRIRVEIAVDQDEAVTAGLLAKDRTFTLLQPPGVLAIGTHFSELAARFDDTPTDSLLLVGSPVDVERARRTGDFENVVTWAVRSESGR